MKKLLPLLLLCSFVFVACTEKTDDRTIPDNVDNDVSLNDTNDKYTAQSLDKNLLPEDPTYISSLRTIDTNLRTQLEGIDTKDTSDIDLTTRGNYYSQRAVAYQNALNELNKLKYDTNNSEYNSAVRSYYEEGFNLYNDMATNYATFKTPADEKTYLDKLGEQGRKISEDIERGYNDALNNFGLYVND